jgi:hypothetical protein
MAHSAMTVFVAAGLAAAAISLAGVRGAGLTPTVAPPRASAGPAGAGSAVPGILISRQLAEVRDLQVGEVVRLAVDPAGVRHQAFRIDGIYEPMPDPMRFAQPRYEARLHLPDLLALTLDPDDPLADDAVTSINVALHDPSGAPTVAADIARRLPDLVASPVDGEDDRTATFVVLERFHLAIAIVTVVGAAVFLLALMVMLVDERRATVGTLRLLGFTRRRILLQVLTEGAVIALAGAVFGILFALATERSFNTFFQWRYDTALVFLRITPSVIGTALLFAIPLGMLASLAASWTLMREQVLALIRR